MEIKREYHHNGGGNAEYCRSLESFVCDCFNFTRSTQHKSHADAFTQNGETVQIKTFLKNAPSIGYKYFKACYKKGIENPTVEQVVTEYFNGIDLLVCYIDKDKGLPLKAENCHVMNKDEGIKWIVARAKMSYDSQKHPQIKINKSVRV